MSTSKGPVEEALMTVMVHRTVGAEGTDATCFGVDVDGEKRCA
jgi:hypothetical protein